jgi:hypothetical protein
VLGQNIMVVGVCVGENFSPHDGPETENKRQEGAKDKIHPKDPPNPSDLLPPAKSYPLVSRTSLNSATSCGPRPQHMRLFLGGGDVGYFISKL